MTKRKIGVILRKDWDNNVKLYDMGTDLNSLRLKTKELNNNSSVSEYRYYFYWKFVDV